MKIVVVGGVAGGASAAAKARRTDERAEIVVFERGPYVSFANCGLPYYVADEIKERADLLLQTPASFWKRFRIAVKVSHEVLRVHRAEKRVEVRDLKTGAVFREAYDKLVLAPGAGAIVPPLPGIKSANIFSVKTVPDSDAIRKFIDEKNPKRAVVVGAGFIGLESAEALKKRGLEVAVVEMADQVLPPFDADVARFVAEHLEGSGVRLVLSDGIKAFHGSPLASEVELQTGTRVPMDLAILSIGVRPELQLARDAGLAIGEAGGIAVDESQRTSDPDIFAAGDAAEVVHLVTGRKVRIPLAGPANKQGRVAGANAAGGKLTFPGTLGTAIVESMGISAAKTGLSEREAKAAGIPCFVSVIHPFDHAGYYPGSKMMHIKLVVESGSGRLLGAQIVGEAGVDKRIDVFATALFARLKVTDLESLDLAYAPQFSSAKDPVVMAGFVASNVVRREASTITCAELQSKREKGEPVQVVDVRTPKEYAEEHLPEAKAIPVDELRDRLKELDPEKETVVYCRVGLRAYLAARILEQNGFKKVFNLTGGLLACPRDGRPRTEPHPEDRVTAETLRGLIGKRGVVALDVREEDEYRYEHIAGTVNLPLSRMSRSLAALRKDQDIYVLCRSGVRTNQAIGILTSSGYPRARCVEGGLEAWKAARFPLERSGGPLPILRQVQIVVGALILLSALHPKVHWVGWLMGAGLLFAGLSGWCGMAAVLARLPWNRRAPSEPKPGGPPGCCP